MQTLNRRLNNIRKALLQSYKTQIKILVYPGLAFPRFEQQGPRTSLLSLAKSTHYMIQPKSVSLKFNSTTIIPIL